MLSLNNTSMSLKASGQLQFQPVLTRKNYSVGLFRPAKMTPSSGCSNYDAGNCINIRCYGSFWSSLLQPVDGINVAFFTSCILRPILLLIMRMALYCSPQFVCFCHRLSSGSHRPIYTHTGIFSLSQLFLQTT